VSRLFDPASGNASYWPATPHSTNNVAVNSATYAALGWRTNAGVWAGCISIDDASGVNASHNMEWNQNGTTLLLEQPVSQLGDITPTFIPADSDAWHITAVTKPAGTDATVRWHQFKFSTGVWTHGSTATTCDSASIETGSSGFNVGSWTHQSVSDQWSGPLGAVALWNYEMSDREVERLAAGQWALWDPLYLVEFPDGDRNALIRRRDRYGRPIQTAGVGTSIDTHARPAGFRYSTVGRRHG
jgi:hypothetical protein